MACELAELLVPTNPDRLLIAGASSLLTTSGAGVDGSPTITGNASARRVRTNAAVDSDPSAPTPGPAPGSSGASAAGSGAGSAPSTPFAANSLFLHAAPTHAMWRLRLVRLSWRTSFFALIPERPD